MSLSLISSRTRRNLRVVNPIPPARFCEAIRFCPTAVKLWLLALLFLFEAVHSAPAKPPETTTFSGQEYINAADWAASQKLTFTWLEGRKSFELRGSKVLVAEVDSRRFVLGGVVAYGSAPVAAKDSKAWIASRDVRKLLLPFLSPPKLSGSSRIRTICIDAGHGGRDPGNSHGKLREKDLTLRLAQELQTILQKAGYKVVMTRSSDRYPELDERPAFANRRRADLFLSLHFNSAVDAEGVRGVETFCLTPAGHPSTNERQTSNHLILPGNRQDPFNFLLAYQIQKGLVSHLEAEDRGVKRQRLAVLKSTVMPAVLIEAGFLTDAQEARLIANPNYLVKIAEGIRRGVDAYRNQVERR